MLFTRSIAAIVAPVVIAILSAPAVRGAKHPCRIEFEGLQHGTFKATNVTLMEMLAAVYGMVERRVIGPDWLSQEHFGNWG